VKSVAAYGQNIRSCDGDPSLAEVNYVNCINYMNCIGLINYLTVRCNIKRLCR